MPVVLWFLTRETGHLHVAPLSTLTPYPSVEPHYDIVNFPLTEMERVVTFDTTNLNKYFNSPRGNNLPTQQQCKMLMDWLSPRQIVFDAFVNHFLDVLEKRWKNQFRDSSG
jgi:hypothetical protein